jgi:alpha-galactosidase
MFFEFAEQIKQWCPDAFVINYTNPMSLCVGALYRAFPEIKCFGCCHEVFGTKYFLRDVVQKKLGLTGLTRNDIKINVLGVNHFTWITEAHYKNVDIFPLYQEFCEEMKDIGCPNAQPEDDPFYNCEKVKMDLFLKYGYIAAAGDRHLAEFCPRSWYLKDAETAHKWGFNLTPVSYRKNQLKDRYAQQQRLLSGEEDIKIEPTGEEGVLQMSALLGLDDFVTNVNLPNQGQIPNLPIGAIVETNARFCSGSVRPVFAGPIPAEVKPLVDRAVDTQRLVLDAAWERDLEKAFIAFTTEQNNGLTLEESRKLFDTMLENTKAYLKSYFQ